MSVEGFLCVSVCLVGHLCVCAPVCVCVCVCAGQGSAGLMVTPLVGEQGTSGG